MSDAYDDLMASEPNEEQFYKATIFLQQNIGLFQQKELLQFYGLYKQATVGACNIPKPGIFSAQSRAKWYAWSEVSHLDQQTAKAHYVRLMDSLQPEWSCRSRVASGDHNVSSTCSWVSVSLPKREEEKKSSSLVDHVKEGNVDIVRSIIETGDVRTEDLNNLDEAGLGLLHWAADRGNAAVLQCLLVAEGINVNLCDSDGQTALHYASSCGNHECILLLRKHNADCTIKDANGDTCVDVAFNEKIKTLLN
ncbi:acyl-CoA-binding domain-containing protein 6 [Anopheles nili]|uniref:acyl-CoA-binding domain-containing protein 6 n=1 Tax=Anopheles nili TaxID=185578 RepID=UPI00237A9CFB|nr:acyl-CoA-binding domain-containing protein 6 [Anopheles nili]